jgi:tRNA pseudouridine65 synthase
MIPIIYEDEFYVIVDKPAKLLVHRTGISRDTTFLLQELRNQLGYHIFPVHRLDRPTSGLIIFGKTKEAHLKMSKLFTEREIEKTYLAVVRGWTGDGIIDKPLRKMTDNSGLVGEYSEAITHYKELTCYELPFLVDKYPKTRYSLVELKPKTGRYHQIRRHMKSISHPLLGDTNYGKSTHNNFLKDTIGLNRLMLMASSLKFIHPFTQKEMEINIKKDADFNHFINWAKPYKI